MIKIKDIKCAGPKKKSSQTSISPQRKSASQDALIAELKDHSESLVAPTEPSRSDVPTAETGGGFDRNAYQREYMRKRRAKSKLSASSSPQRP
jgi:hypothetical protein